MGKDLSASGGSTLEGGNPPAKRKFRPPKNAVTQQSRGNKVSEVTLLDTTGTMTLDLWNEQIAQVQIDCVYRFTSLSTS